MGKDKKDKEAKQEKEGKKEKRARTDDEGGEAKKAAKEQGDGDGAEEYVQSIIATPQAGEKLEKNILKLVKESAKVKALRRGVKEVVKALRKGETGVCIIAGNISPIDVISHIPVLCEESSVPYVYTRSKEVLGVAAQTKRPTSIVLIKKHGDYEDKFKELAHKVKALHSV